MISLVSLDLRVDAIVVDIKTQQDTILHKLFAMGVMPGVPLLLEQRFPSYVIKIGRSRVALDTETAKTIFVQLKASP
ncbi:MULTISPECIES: FeoA family protein [Arthrospira]|jgi:ferrous iron transport protein A|uniref:Ferrous iron transporter FeoA-like domain-containing protein n=1 Tax=Limnospira platensis NIES-46 TaxID=1236695 RepID=A0A5M3T2V8_LIMPL|nr:MULTISPECIES: FeoA family protein [Arthrospira]AMW29781.1 iron transporter FeoA [Arthrospira platensis YZ]KDR54141.1 iron transporter FeoA [Arthrospira platensis str. Paraca]MBD2669515.1 ferrous iron transport protein A [Arthrospira platensis FACHB-439]MBD2710088.1 ferrous iron transport protein A [Arthrospira platensis FACHB-835]MDF2212224.1 FeoA family protein [Arthrospira platensis NCB002]MDT9182707.1 FeoA family protein [Limnospira sp. PMC 289.06]MDT9294823.1 FeoA family protein [Arth